VILVDANLLLYAYHPRAEQHASSRAFIESALSGSEPVCFSWSTLWAFLRISTNPHAFEFPLSLSEVDAAVESWLSQPVVGILEPGERHWEILRRLVREGQCVSASITDAALAAIAVEHGATLHTTDRGFARFPGLSFRNPLQTR